MGIIDDVVVNAKSAAESVGKTASMLVDVSKLKISISEINADITKRKQMLGEYVYENCHDNTWGDSEVSGRIAEIDELVERAQSINRVLLDKQNKAVCSVCGKTSPSSATFCSHCGTKLEKVNPFAEAEPAEPKAEETPASTVDESNNSEE